MFRAEPFSLLEPQAVEVGGDNGKFKYLRPQETLLKINNKANLTTAPWGAILLFLTTMVVSGCMPLSVQWAQGHSGSYPFLVSVWMCGLKLLVCLLSAALFFLDRYYSPPASGDDDDDETKRPQGLNKWRRGLVMLPPAVLYTVSDLLLFPILQRTDPSTYAVLRQVKIAITALLFRFALRRSVSFLQWVAVLQLLLSALLFREDTLMSVWEHSDSAKSRSQMEAMLLILVKVTCDASAVIWSDWCFKRSHSSPGHSLSFPELQLFFAFWTFLFSLAYFSVMDGSSVLRGEVSIFGGFGTAAFCSMVAFAMYGMLMSVFMKYLDSLNKLFMDMGAILVTTSVDVSVFGASISVTEGFAAVYIIIAAFIYKLGTVVTGRGKRRLKTLAI